jgi:DNA gyrase subunit A
VGVRAIQLRAGDYLVSSLVVRPEGGDLLVSTKVGQLIRVATSNISVLSRGAKGHKVVSIKKDDEAVGAVLLGS